MQRTLGLKEQFRAGTISVSEALTHLEEADALDSKTANWFKRKQRAGDVQRDPSHTEKVKARNLEVNKPKEHNRAWRLGRGRFETVVSTPQE